MAFRWLVQFELNGRVWRFATTATTVVADGQAVQFAEGLEDPGPLSKILPSGEKLARITISSGDDWPAILESGRWEVEGGPVHLYWWEEGQALEDAVEWMAGQVLDVEWDEQGEPLAFSIWRPAQSWPILHPQARVDESTHPVSGGSYAVADRAMGRSYPLIIGYPGHDESSAAPRPAVPVPVADYNGILAVLLVVADQQIDATTVRAHNVSANTLADLAVSTRADLLGRTYSYVSGGGDLIAGVLADSEWAIGFRDDGSYGGGLVSDGQVVRGLGDVFEYFLTAYTELRIDRGRLEAHRAWLNEFKVDTFINDESTVIEWLEDVIQHMPVRIVEGPEGFWLAPIRYDATRVDASLVLDASVPDINAASRVRRATDDVVNELTVGFCPNRSASAYLQTRILTAEYYRPAGYRYTTDPRIIELGLCKESQDRYGPQPGLIELPHVWHSGTAVAIGRHYLERYARRRDVVTMTAPPGLWRTDIGQVGLLRDPARNMSERTFIVDDVRVGEEEVELDLILL